MNTSLHFCLLLYYSVLQ